MRLRCALGMALMTLVVAGTARAQSGDSSALAEQLFNQGRDLAKANRWSEACPKFEASLRYDPVLGTRLNLATCYERIGKLASAWAHYRDSIDVAKKAGDTKRQDYAKIQAAALEPRLAKLTITAPAKAPAGFTVTRDGTPLEAGAFGAALYADAGPHEIVASAPSFKSFTRTVILVDGAADTLVIPDLEPAVAAPPPTTVKPPTDEPVVDTAPATSSKRKYIALGAGAAGVAAIGVGLFFGSKASSGFDDAKALCGEELVCDNAADLAKANDLMSDARSKATISTVLVIGGGAAIAAGAVLYLTAPRAKERAASARITPVPHNGGAGVVLTGRF